MEEKDYIFFDIECSDGNHICSFGYIIVDKGFNIKEKRDIIINPEWRFKLGRDGFDPRIDLAYDKNYFESQQNFDFFYNDIKRLLTTENRVVLGHCVSSDLGFIRIACERYNKEKIDIIAYDTQDMYYQLNKKQKHMSLEKIINELGIDISHLRSHKSCDDAEMSMLVAQKICMEMDCDIEQLLDYCSTSTVKTKEKKERKPRIWLDKKPEFKIEDSPIYKQICEQLKKKGMTYEEYVGNNE